MATCNKKKTSAWGRSRRVARTPTLTSRFGSVRPQGRTKGVAMGFSDCLVPLPETIRAEEVKGPTSSSMGEATMEKGKSRAS